MRLEPDLQKLLLALAREAIARGLATGRASVPQAGRLRAPLDEPGASFVTLTRDGVLRGCCGVLEPVRPLAVDVMHNAFTTAFKDPRFRPVDSDELEAVRIEVAVLSPLEPIEAASEADLLATVRPGKDGLVMENGRVRTTLLPKVWESLPEAQTFIVALKRKAGLPAGFWSPDLRFLRYQAVSFGET